MTKRILQNEVICNLCNDRIFSRHRHDFVTCSCGNISVDGGMDYLKRVGLGITNKTYTDVSMEMEEEALQDCINAVNWGIDTKRNSLGIALAVFRALRDHELLKI